MTQTLNGSNMIDEGKERSEFITAILNYLRPETKLFWKARDLPEESLEKSLEDLEKSISPTKTDKRLRTSLNMHLRLAAQGGNIATVGEICKGICHPGHFAKLLDNPDRVAYYILPLQDDRVEILHQFAQSRAVLTDLLSLSYKQSDGSIDHKILNVVKSAATTLYNKALPDLQKNLGNTEEPKMIENVQDEIKLLKQEVGEDE